MKTLIKILLLLLICATVNAQAPAPSGLAAPYSTGYYRIGWVQSDSGTIIGSRVPNFTPKFYGTEVTYVNPGVDTSVWVWIGRWVKQLKQGDVIPTIWGNITGTLSNQTDLQNALNSKLSNITGYIQAGSNVSITGFGTQVSPYVINSTASGGGSVNGFSFTNGNGITGIVTNPTTTPNLSLGTSLNGIINGNGTGFSTVSIGGGLNYSGGVLSATGGTSLNGLVSANGSAFTTASIGAGLSFISNTLTNTINNTNQLTNGAGFISNITGLITPGANITFSGSGTSGSPYVINSTAGGSGTVTVFSSGNLSPIFTTSVSNPNTIPAQSFALSNAAASAVLGNNTGSSAPPTYFVPTASTINNWQGFAPARSVKTIINLYSFNTSGLNDSSVVFVTDTVAGGPMMWVSASTTVEDSGTVFKPTAISSGSPGRWIRQYSGLKSVRFWGVLGDGSTNVTRRTQLAMNSCVGGTLYFPSGVYVIDSLIYPAQLSIRGESRRNTRLQATASGAQSFIRLGPGQSNEIYWIDLSLQANASNAGQNAFDFTAVPGSTTGGLWNFEMDRVDVTNFRGTGINLYCHDGAFDMAHQFLTFRQVRVYCTTDTSSHAVVWNGQVNQTTFDDCEFDCPAWVAGTRGVILISSGTSNDQIVGGNTFHNISVQGFDQAVYTYNAQGVAFTNDYFESDSVGIYATNSSRITVYDIHLSNVGNTRYVFGNDNSVLDILGYRLTPNPITGKFYTSPGGTSGGGVIQRGVGQTNNTVTTIFIGQNVNVSANTLNTGYFTDVITNVGSSVSSYVTTINSNLSPTEHLFIRAYDATHTSNNALLFKAGGNISLPGSLDSGMLVLHDGQSVEFMRTDVGSSVWAMVPSSVTPLYMSVFPTTGLWITGNVVYNSNPAFGTAGIWVCKKGGIGAAALWDSLVVGAGGGGSTNSNVGSGYRLAVPGTNNIKTIFGSTFISWDSTSNANALTSKLANGTANNILGWDGSGNPASLAPDTLFVKNRVSGTGVQIGNISSDTLYLNNLVAGANITLTHNADSSITIAATGGGGSGITSLNGLTGATQTFSHVSSGGTGTTFTITSSGTNHQFATPIYYDYGSRTIVSSLNTFWGAGAGSNSITTGQYNTGFGANVLGNITTGMYNTAFGMGVLNGTQRGMGNVGMGWLALALCDSCMNETAIGGGALSGDTAGIGNTALGYGAGDFMSFGKNNVYIGLQAAQVARFSSFNIQIGAQVSAQVDGDSTDIMIGYHNNYTNHKISKRSIMIGDLIGNTFNTNYDSVILIGSSLTTTTDTLLRNTIFIGNFGLTSRSNFANFGTKSQLIQLGNGGGSTAAMNAFTQVSSDIFFNTDSMATGSGYCVWNGTLSKWINLGRTAAGNTVSVTNSITGDGSSGTPLKLVNDAATPGNSQYYGTNSGGTKGFFALPTTSSVSLSGITAATATNSIDNVNFLQTWNWNSLSGSAIQLYSNSTAAAGNAQMILDILMQGANATSSQTTYAANIQNLHSGTGAVNVGMHIKTTGAGTNYPLITEGGLVGIGTLTPTVNLHVVGSNSTIYAEGNNANGYSEISGRTNNGSGQWELYALSSGYSGTVGAGFDAGHAYMRFTGVGGVNVSAQNTTGTLKFFTGGEGVANEAMRIDSIKRVHIDTTGGSSRFNVGGSFNDNYPGVRGYLSTFEKGNFRDNNSTASSTVAIIATNSFLQGNVSALQSNVTYTKAATVYIDSSTKASTNVTITNSYSLLVGTGTTRLGVGASNFSLITDGGTYLNGFSGTNTVGVGLGASTTTQVSLQFAQGVDLTSVSGGNTGGIWWNGTNLYFVDGTPVKRDLLNGIHNYLHSISTPATGGTVNLVANQYNIVNPSGAIAALTVNLPSSPNNNDVVYIKYTQTVTTVTYGNGTVIDGITTPSAGGLVILTFDSGTSSWY